VRTKRYPKKSTRTLLIVQGIRWSKGRKGAGRCFESATPDRIPDHGVTHRAEQRSASRVARVAVNRLGCAEKVRNGVMNNCLCCLRAIRARLTWVGRRNQIVVNAKTSLSPRVCQRHRKTCCPKSSNVRVRGLWVTMYHESPRFDPSGVDSGVVG